MEEKNKAQPQGEKVEGLQDVDEGEPGSSRPIDRWMASFKQGMETRRLQKRRIRDRATRDRMKPAILSLLSVIVIVVILLGVFSTPMSRKKQPLMSQRKTPNLGRPQVNDSLVQEPENLERSVTPLLGADVRPEPDPNRGLVSESDFQKYGTRNTPAVPAIQPLQSAIKTPPNTSKNPYAIGQIEFSDTGGGKSESLAGVESRIGRLQSQTENGQNGRKPKPPDDRFAKPSLVFVHSTNIVQSTPVPDTARPGLEASDLVSPMELPAGKRLMVRLQSAITTAIVTPVVAMVEYNYEKNGETVVPAGSKVFGKLEQANRSGHVSVRFDTIQTPGGVTSKIDGVAQALDYGPLKGKVDGKNTVTRFVTRAMTGVGEVASQVVGLRGGLSGPLSNSLLLRERLANNIAQAGDQQLQQMALSNNIVVTVPGNTRFYVVLQKSAGGEINAMVSHQVSSTVERDKPNNSQNLTRAELQELRNLKQEFQRLMLMAKGQATTNSSTSSYESTDP